MGNTLTHKPRKYRSYLLESPRHNQSIISNYGMPLYAKPPRQNELLPTNSDTQFRATLSRTLYMKKGGSFNV